MTPSTFFTPHDRTIKCVEWKNGAMSIHFRDGVTVLYRGVPEIAYRTYVSGYLKISLEDCREFETH